MVGIDLSVMPDEELLCRLQEGDEAALAALYDRHARTAYMLAYRVVAHSETAEDVVQEAFLTIWRRATTYTPERGSVRSWLLMVVRNRAIDTVRQRDGRSVAGRTRSRAELPLDDVVLVSSEDPEHEAIQEGERRVIRQALAALPVEQRRTVELAYFSGLAYPQIAAQLGVPVGTVKSRMRLALTRLRTLTTSQLVVAS